eukprot:TRINITY_DN5852_c0_g1_i1.p1 TRINITY_DN5852_c0_g1~~TRINITY_DN5852_c0_g1_i1.p1  ORF type:complete len:492 (+),score=43.29 TRINITY_DN5852_c0_g1_i1:55-1530(+)
MTLEMPRKILAATNLAYTVCILLIIIAHTQGDLIFNDAPGFPNIQVAPVLMFPGGINRFEPISGQLVYENDTDAANSDLAGNGNRIALYDDKIVLARGNKVSSSFKWLSYLATSAHVRAVVMETGDVDAAVGDLEFSGALYNTTYPFPVIGVSSTSRVAIVAAIIDSNSTTVAVTITDNGQSPWRTALFSPAWWICSIVMATLGCAVCVASAIRFSEYWRSLGRFHAGVPQFVLIFEFCVGLMMFLYWGLDPLGARSIVPHAMHASWRTFPLAFSLSGIMILIFYWHESLSNTSLRFSWSVDQYKGRLFFIIVFIFLMEVGCAIVYYVEKEGQAAWLVLYARPAVYVLIGIATSLFYIITASRIIIAISKLRVSTTSSHNSSGEETAREGRRLKPIAVKLLFIGSGYTLAVVSGFYTLSPGFSRRIPVHYMYPWVAIHFFLILKAFASVAVLVPPTWKTKISLTTRQSTVGTSIQAHASGVTTGALLSDSV